MSDYMGQAPKDGDYASLISKLEDDSLKSLQDAGAKQMHEGAASQGAAVPQAASGRANGTAGATLSKKRSRQDPGFANGTVMQNGGGARRSGKSHSSGMNAFVYFGIIAALAVMFAISGDPEFGGFCIAAFIIVSIAFFSSRKASARRRTANRRN
jgi:hypothetical protein